MATKKPLHGAAASNVLAPEARKAREARGVDTEAVAAVPLLANDQSIGTLMVTDETNGRRFTEDEVSLLAAFADQAALALEKARLLNEAETERERADSLYRISNLLAGAHDTEEILELIVNEAARLVGTNAGIIRLVKGDSLVFGAATEAAADYFSAIVEQTPAIDISGEGSGVMSRTLATKTPILTEDITKEATVAPEVRLIQEKFGYRGNATIPLLAEGRAIGALSIFDTRIRRFNEDEVSLLTAFADQAALALEKARLLSEAEARERQATQLYEVTTQLASNHDLNSVLDLITEQAVGLIGGISGILWQFDEAKGGLVAVNTLNTISEILNVVIPPGEGIAGQAYTSRRAIWTSDSP